MSEPKDYWLDRSENVTKLFKGLWAVGIALLFIDLLLHRHEEFGFSAWFGFYGIFGFFACVVLVLVAKKLRVILMRPEDYYER
jgi:hypothetical protein